MAEQNDNSGVGVILGVLLTLVILAGGYFFLKNEGASLDGGERVTNIEMPDVDVNVPKPDVEPAAE
jgi:hypothetical protein